VPQKTLRFTGEELRAYCTLMDFRQGEDALEKVSKYTGGWISLAYLILLGLEQGIPIGQSSAIGELVEKILYNLTTRRSGNFFCAFRLWMSLRKNRPGM
jgi:LuxR family maltose regulon positive regulatory protein